LADIAAFAAVRPWVAASLKGRQSQDDEDTDACCSAIKFALASGIWPTAISADGKSGKSALGAAAVSNRPDVVRFLLATWDQSLMPVNARDTHGAAPLHYAAVEGHDHVCKVLLEGGAWVDIEDDIGVRPLQLASESGHVSTVKVLIEAAADVNASDMSLNTPLLAAAQAGDAITCAVLSAAGANALASNLYGHSPLGVAREAGSLELVRVLSQPPSAKRTSTLANWTNPETPIADRSINLPDLLGGRVIGLPSSIIDSMRLRPRLQSGLLAH